MCYHFLINTEAVSHSMRHFNAKLVGLPEETGLSLLHKRDNGLTFLEDMWHPPVKGRFMVNILHDGILSHEDRISLLQVSKAFPGR